jgi:ribonuclease HI
MQTVMSGDGSRILDKANVKNFHIDGAGKGPDGRGSGWAWVYENTAEHRIRWVDGWTNNEAEYHGLLAVLKYVARESRLRIFTDSQLVASQFAGKFRVNEPRLQQLLDEAKRLIEERGLEVEVKWISRRENLAGKLLDSN